MLLASDRPPRLRRLFFRLARGPARPSTARADLKPSWHDSGSAVLESVNAGRDSGCDRFKRTPGSSLIFPPRLIGRPLGCSAWPPSSVDDRRHRRASAMMVCALAKTASPTRMIRQTRSARRVEAPISTAEVPAGSGLASVTCPVCFIRHPVRCARKQHQLKAMDVR